MKEKSHFLIGDSNGDEFLPGPDPWVCDQAWRCKGNRLFLLQPGHLHYVGWKLLCRNISTVNGLRLIHKQNRYPVLLLTQGQNSKYPDFRDPRCQMSLACHPWFLTGPGVYARECSLGKWPGCWGFQPWRKPSPGTQPRCSWWRNAARWSSVGQTRTTPRRLFSPWRTLGWTEWSTTEWTRTGLTLPLLWREGNPTSSILSFIQIDTALNIRLADLTSDSDSSEESEGSEESASSDQQQMPQGVWRPKLRGQRPRSSLSFSGPLTWSKRKNLADLIYVATSAFVYL